MKNNKALLLILLLSFILRLINLNQSLWLDEAINVVYAKSNDFVWFITKYPIGDFHPPGWFATLWIWGHIFGWSEISVRLPAVIFGVLTIFFTYLIGRRLLSKKVGLVAALMMCLSPLHIYYSQEARMYSLSTFAVTFSLFSFMILLAKKKFGWLAFLISTIFVLYSDYVAYFIFPVQLIYLLIYYRSLLKIYLLTFLSAIFFYFPWLFILPSQITNGLQTAAVISGWKNVVGGSSIKELLLLGTKIIIGKISFYNNIFYAAIFSILGLPFVITLVNVRKVLNKNSLLIIFWLILTPTLVWLFSLIIPVFSYFRLIFILPAFYIIISLCLSKFSKRMFSALLVFILLSEIIASCLYLFVDNFHRENWKQASLVSYGQNNAAVIFEDNELLAPFLYYNQKSNAVLPGLINKPAKSIADINNLQFLLENYEKVYLFDYLVEINDPQRLVERELVDLGYRKVQQFDYRGVGFVALYED